MAVARQRQLTVAVAERPTPNPSFPLPPIFPIFLIFPRYGSGCHFLDNTKEETNRERKYIIRSSHVHERLMVTCLEGFHVAFDHHLPVAKSKRTAKNVIPSSSQAWPRMVRTLDT